jgi:hypothetical protein
VVSRIVELDGRFPLESRVRNDAIEIAAQRCIAIDLDSGGRSAIDYT